jgi:hypothetical protein
MGQMRGCGISKRVEWHHGYRKVGNATCASGKKTPFFYFILISICIPQQLPKEDAVIPV